MEILPSDVAIQEHTEWNLRETACNRWSSADTHNRTSLCKCDSHWLCITRDGEGLQNTGSKDVSNDTIKVCIVVWVHLISKSLKIKGKLESMYYKERDRSDLTTESWLVKTTACWIKCLSSWTEIDCLLFFVCPALPPSLTKVQK